MSGLTRPILSLLLQFLSCDMVMQHLCIFSLRSMSVCVSLNPDIYLVIHDCCLILKTNSIVALSLSCVSPGVFFYNNSNLFLIELTLKYKV